MRNNKELLEKIKKMDQEVKHELGITEAFQASSREVMHAALNSVQDVINPVTAAELIFLIPALRVITDSLEYFLDGQERSVTKAVHAIMKTMVVEVKKVENRREHYDSGEKGV